MIMQQVYHDRSLPVVESQAHRSRIRASEDDDNAVAVTSILGREQFVL